MSDTSKVKPTHTQRAAVIYVRQSNPAQVQHNRESTERQYELVQRALDLGWRQEQITLVDDDLGVSADGIAKRAGFAQLTADVALLKVGIVVGIEVSRLARNNANWYRLLDLCGITDTLLADTDGIYHPGLFNDRLLLGLKGTMSEAELHILRERLDGGIRHKAARGALRRGLPVGLVWGDKEGEIRFHPDEAVTSALRAVFTRFAEVGSARQVWLWFRAEGLSLPLQAYGVPDLRWVTPTYTAIHKVLTSPVYAGAYVYGKTRAERFVAADGTIQRRIRRLPRAEWAVLILDHHEGFIDWATYEANQTRLATNVHPAPHQAGGAVREGPALLQGLATCGHCGRRLHTHYQGRHAAPGYHCSGKDLVEGRGVYCLNIGGLQIDAAVTTAFLTALTPAALDATLVAAQQLDADHDTALAQWRLALERTRYEAERAERRYRAVEPENRLVARGLEADWERRLRELEQAQRELADRESRRPRALGPADTERLRALGDDLRRVWTAPTTTARDKKELLRALLEDVVIAVERSEARADLTLRWRGGTVTTLEVNLPHSNPPRIHTDEDSLALIRRLAPHYPDAVIAGILNRQGRRTARGERFTAPHVGNLRRYRRIPRCEPPAECSDGALVTIKTAAAILGVAPSTLHRWLIAGIIVGEQLTPGAPWRIRITDELRARFVEEAPPEYLPMLEARLRLGVSRQTVLQRVKRGELETLHVRRGRRKGLRIKVVTEHPDLFPNLP
jgi:DNA invertase Pin-like site-specific DNA recombinase